MAKTTKKEPIKDISKFLICIYSGTVKESRNKRSRAFNELWSISKFGHPRVLNFEFSPEPNSLPLSRNIYLITRQRSHISTDNINKSLETLRIRNDNGRIMRVIAFLPF